MPGLSVTANPQSSACKKTINTLSYVTFAPNSSARHSKQARRVLCQGVRLQCAFINRLSTHYSVRRLCLALNVYASGYCAWLAEPKSARAKDNQPLLGLIKHVWLESGGVYGYRKTHNDLRELAKQCARDRVAQLMRLDRLRSQTGYRGRPGHYGGKPAVASATHLARRPNVTEPT
jgi:putative transposase